MVPGSHAQENQAMWNEERVLELNSQAAELLESGNYQKAKTLIDQALSASREINSFEGEAEALFYLGSYYESRGIPDSTIIHLEKNLDKFIDSSTAIRMGNVLGTAYMSAGRYQQGLEIYLRTLELAEERGEERLMIGITLNLGNSYQILGEIPDAIESFLISLELAEQRQDTMIIALAMNNLASINTHQQNYELSEEYLMRALDLNIISGNVHNQINNYISLGVLYREMGDFEASFENFQKGLNLTTDNSILLPEIQLLHNLGTLYLKFEILDKALKYFGESFRLSRENNIRDGYFFNQIRLGETYEMMKEYPTALSYYRSALDSAEDTGGMEHIMGTLESLYNLSALTGDTSLAFNYLKRYSTISDSLTQAGREEALARQEAVLGFRLEQENRMALETAYQNKHRNFLIAIMLMVLLIILLAAIVWFYLKKRETNDLLRKKTDELTRVNKLKDNLLNVLAHDLRTPLSNLKGVVFLIRKNALERQVIHETLDNIETKLQQGISTLTNYIQWAQSQWDGVEVRLSPQNIYEHIESAIEEYSGFSKMKNITVLNKADKNAAAYADRHLLSVVLRNLLSNAIKFTHQNGTIIIQSETAREHINISVIDTGMGIPPEKQEHLFTPLAYTALGTEGEPGTGLGLSICKDFVEKQNGKITVKCTPGKGSAFTIKLKKAVNMGILTDSLHTQTA